jgi:uncharacterized membrane protein HdeD (DUF308 family)
MEVGDQHGVDPGPDLRPGRRPVAAQVSDPVAQDRVGQQADPVELDQDRGMPDVTDTGLPPVYGVIPRRSRVRGATYRSPRQSGSKGEGMESTVSPGARVALRDISRLWWLWLVISVAWVVVGVVILQFDQASVTTVGVIVGIMFWGAAVQSFVVGSLAERMRWLYYIFGVLFAAAGVIAFISPENTFAAIADILGFLFLLVGTFWIIQALATREVNELWWFGLIAGVLMVILAFWTGGQFFIEKAYVLLVFAGIWALMQGVTDIIRAFQIRKLNQLV